MSLMSMTGFGRDEAAFEDWQWVWEIRAVNSKGLDIRLRLPQGFESLELPVRKYAAKALRRGAVQISLNIHCVGGMGAYALDTAWLETLITQAEDIYKFHPTLRPASINGLFRIEGVVTEPTANASAPELEPRNTAILKSLNKALKALKASRHKEGKALGRVLRKQISDFDKCLGRAKTCDGARLETIKSRLAETIAELAPEAFSEERLAQEVALLTIKADVREELDRLDAHLIQAKTLLKTGSPVGRKLDFLVQEFMREINTLCSKSGDIDLTQTGLAMKSLIEQFREQAANVE